MSNFKNVETIPPANTNAGFRLLETITEEDDDIQYVSGNVFVPSKIEYESFEDNEDWEVSKSTTLLRQKLNIGWHNDDDVGEETTMAAKLHDIDHTASGANGYLSKWEDLRNDSGYNIPIKRLTIAYHRNANISNLLSYRTLSKRTGLKASSFIQTLL